MKTFYLALTFFTAFVAVWDFMLGQYFFSMLMGAFTVFNWISYRKFSMKSESKEDARVYDLEKERKKKIASLYGREEE